MLVNPEGYNLIYVIMFMIVKKISSSYSVIVRVRVVLRRTVVTVNIYYVKKIN